MKKILALPVCLLSAAALCACGPTPKSSSDADALKENADNTIEQTEQKQTIQTETDESNKTSYGIAIEFIKLVDGAFNRPRVPGVCRHFPPHVDGEYTLEYRHADETDDRNIDYRLTLDDDNTFVLAVTEDDATVARNGRWYLRRGGNISLFCDDYSTGKADVLHGELIPRDKIMLNDDGDIVIMSREPQDDSMHPFMRGGRIRGNSVDGYTFDIVFTQKPVRNTDIDENTDDQSGADKPQILPLTPGIPITA